MSTGKDYGLPAEYADWVEHTDDIMKSQDHIRVHVVENRLNPMGMPFYNRRQLSERVFVPPKPKPTLPAVKPGTVLDFKNVYGMRCRAVRGYTSWTVFASGGRVSNVHGSYEWTNEELLGYISGEYTFVLEGLA